MEPTALKTGAFLGIAPAPALAVETATIVNITDQRYVRQYPYGVYIVEPCRKGERYAATLIPSAKDTADLGDKRTLEFRIGARETAMDIVRQINSDLGDALGFVGVFLCAGDAPTEKELQVAETLLREFYTKQAAEADSLWETTRQVKLITDLMRRAGNWLGLDREWLFAAPRLEECPACATQIKPGVAVCRSCGAILDAEKAAQFGLGPHLVAIPAAPSSATATDSDPAEATQKATGQTKKSK